MTHAHVVATEHSTADLHPCELYAHNSSPRPTRTQFHHSHPVYLQNRVYGEIKDGPDTWLCGLCHDSVHDWISYLLGEARRPVPEPGRNAKAAAQGTVDWYLRAQGTVAA